MKNLTRLVLPCAALLVTLGACNDKDNEPTPEATPATIAARTAYLTSHNWKIDSYTTAGLNNSADLVSPCNKDNIFTFTVNHTLVIDTKGTLCHPGDPQQETGTWAFSKDAQKVTITMGQQSTLPWSDLDWDLKELSATTLHLSFDKDLVRWYGNTSYTGNFILSAQ